VIIFTLFKTVVANRPEMGSTSSYRGELSREQFVVRTLKGRPGEARMNYNFSGISSNTDSLSVFGPGGHLPWKDPCRSPEVPLLQGAGAPTSSSLTTIGEEGARDPHPRGWSQAIPVEIIDAEDPAAARGVPHSPLAATRPEFLHLWR